MVESVRTTVFLLLLLALVTTGPRAAAETGLPRGRWPVAGAVVTAYDPPEVRWGAGHRGVDLAAEPGAAVSATATGTVTYAGVLAGRGVVVVDHGSVRTTYEPVVAEVAVGQQVGAGERIGTLAAGHDCPASACLHWGLRAGEDYLDPLLLIGPSEVQLLPRSATPRPVPPPPELGGGSGALARPADGPTTSPFGMRLHPVTGIWKLHDGTDIGAPCGAPIRASADGVVVSAGWNDAYGYRLLIDHDTGPSGHLVTGYNHAQSAYLVRAGDRVVRGQVVGLVGTTGLSTGCHLHAQAWVDDTLVDPSGWW